MKATKEIIEFLNSNSIRHVRVDHPPVFTCEESDKLVPKLPGAKTKNLFLRDGKGKRHFLVSVPPEKNVDLKQLSLALGVSGLSFGSAERLEKYLKLTPGSVTLLGVLNDKPNHVEVVIDEELWSADALLVHPLVNTSTLVIDKSEISRFFELTGHSPRIVRVPSKSAPPGI